MVMNPILSRPISSAEVSRHLMDMDQSVEASARISAVRQPFSPWGYHAGCHCSNKTVVLPPSSSSTKRFGFDRKRMLLPSRTSNEKPQRRTESRSQTAMSFASEPCWTSFDDGGTTVPSGGKDTTFSHNKIHFRRPSLTHGRESPASVPDGRRSVQATRSRNPSGRRASLSAASSFADRLPYKNSPDYGLSPLIVTSMKLQERPKGPVRSRANSISSTSSVLPTKYSHSSSRRNSNSDHNNKKSSNPPSRKNSLVQNNIPLHVAAAAAVNPTNAEEHEMFINQAAGIDDKFLIGTAENAAANKEVLQIRMEPNDYADDISTVSEGSEDEDEMDANAIANRLLHKCVANLNSYTNLFFYFNVRDYCYFLF